ncbi:MAG: hypothetical protein ACXACR_08585 [Candidatus Hodarchaeales archaeon]
MSKRREASQIVGINTLIQQLSLQIPHYNNISQRILREFCDPFRKISSQQPLASQTTVKESLKQFDTHYRFSNEYFQLPFLWFACDFFDLVHKYLILRKEPLGFIRRTLRKACLFTRKQISLESVPEWEQLQYACNRSIIPLIHIHYTDEVQILDQLHSLIDEYGLGSLNPKRIQNTVKPSLRGPPWRPTQKVQIQTFFDLTQVLWYLHFHPKAFLMSRLLVNLTILKPKEFKKYQQVFSSSKILVSRTYRTLEGSQESFVGRFIIPHNTYDNFLDFLQIGAEKGVFMIIECQKIVDFKHTVSYAFYRAEKGWSYNTDQFKKITRKKNPLKRLNPMFSENLRTTGKWNNEWSCLNSHKRKQMIKALCMYWKNLSYDDLLKLAGNVKLNQDRTRLLEPYNQVLRELHEERVFQIIMAPWGLIRSYSIDLWEITPPRKVNIKWDVIPLEPSTTHSNLNVKLFDFSSDSWKKPKFLNKKRLGKLNF